ncbi:MAG: glycosyltransferase family 39 protein [Candidatus Eremiobacteraeota bacterium]|nr:glycosyltransferase family 39 protein [Candidatus Eremiobacteraeota bacterium]
MSDRPSHNQPADDRIGWAALAFALLLGTALRVWHLTFSSQHTDEAFTFAISSLRIPALLAAVATRDFHPPLFYLATHALMVLVPKPQWDYRIVTAAFGVVTIACVWGVTRRFGGPVAAAAAAFIVALVPALVQYDRIYRMYAVTTALATLSYWLLLEIEQSTTTRRQWLVLAYAAIAIVLPYIDYLGGLVVAVQMLYALARRPVLTSVLVSGAASALAFVAWLGPLREQLPLAGLAISHPGLDTGLLASFQAAFAAGVPPGWLAWPGGAAAPFVCVAAISGVGMWLGRRTVLPWWLGLLWLQVGLSIVLGKNLAYFPRYLLIDIPPLCVSLGLCIARLWSTQRRALAAGCCAVVVAFLGATASNVLLDPYYQFPDWYALNGVMFDAEQPGDAIILDAGYEALAVKDFTAFRNRKTLLFMNPSDFAPILRWVASHPDRRVWYVEHQQYYWDPQRRIAAALRTRPVVLARRWPRRWPVDDVSVMLFDKVPMTIR